MIRQRNRSGGVIIIALLLLMAVTPAMASAQKLEGAAGASVGIGGLGLEGQIGTPRVAAFARWLSNPFMNESRASLGARIWFIGNAGNGIYAYGALSDLKCGRYANGLTTDCDGAWHGADELGAGIEVGSQKSQFSLFMEGGVFVNTRNAEDFPGWTCAAGFRVQVIK